MMEENEMERKENGKLKELIAEYGIKDMKDVHEFVKMLTAETIQTALDAEFENELGYSKYDYKNKQTSNSRNGHSVKTVQGSMGEMEIEIPRDRDGEFEPQLVKKHQTDWTLHNFLRTTAIFQYPDTFFQRICKRVFIYLDKLQRAKMKLDFTWLNELTSSENYLIIS